MRFGFAVLTMLFCITLSAFLILASLGIKMGELTGSGQIAAGLAGILVLAIGVRQLVGERTILISVS